MLSFNCFPLLQTAVAVGVEPENKLPYNEYYEYFGPDYTLHVEPNPMENQNSPRDLEKIRYFYYCTYFCSLRVFPSAAVTPANLMCFLRCVSQTSFSYCILCILLALNKMMLIFFC